MLATHMPDIGQIHLVEMSAIFSKTNPAVNPQVGRNCEGTHARHALTGPGLCSVTPISCANCARPIKRVEPGALSFDDLPITQRRFHKVSTTSRGGSLKGCEIVAGGRSVSADHRSTSRNDFHPGRVAENGGTPPGCGRTLAWIRWSPLRSDHRLLSHSPSG